MFTGDEVVSLLTELGVTHVVWVPDSTIGQWESAIRESSIKLVTVCREGEAWAIAAGLHVGGALPLVMIQCTGLFESGDALRNVLWDFKLPLYAWIGYRSFLSQTAIPNDSAMRFTEPILNAWELDYLLVKSADQLDEMKQHFRECQKNGRSGIMLLGEGKV